MFRKRILPLAAALSVIAQTPEALRDQYNSTYSDATAQASFNHEPNAFMTDVLRDWKPGRALDIGMGQGRNAIWLAKQGWDVTGFDLSNTGVQIARKLAEGTGVKINALVADADQFDYGTDRWDLIVLSYIPFDSFRDRIIRALRPGGVVLVENLHGDSRRVRLIGTGFRNNELLQAFPGLRVLRYEDVWARQDWGRQLEGNNRLVRLLAQKPAAPDAPCEWERKPHAVGDEVCWGVLKMRCTAEGWERSGSCVR